MKIHWSIGMIVMVFVIFLMGCDIAHKKTVHVIVCDQASLPLNVRLLLEGPEKREYKIYPAQQIVTKKIASIGSVTYQNCSIYDADNWTCLLKNQAITVEMRDGTYFPLYRKLSENFFEKRIHWLEYWILKAKLLINKDASISSCEYHRRLYADFNKMLEKLSSEYHVETFNNLNEAR